MHIGRRRGGKKDEGQGHETMRGTMAVNNEGRKKMGKKMSDDEIKRVTRVTIIRKKKWGSM